MVHRVYVVGVGMGNPRTLTCEAKEALAQSELVVGSSRLLEALQDECAGARMVALVSARQIASELRESDASVACVAMSGDVGFYSGATGLYEHLQGMDVHVIPGVSSLAYLCARLQVPWQDAHVVSVHGRAADVAGAVQSHAKTFVLAGGRVTPREVCAELVGRGLGAVRVSVGERLSYDDERVTSGTAAELAGKAFDQLAVMLIANNRPIVRQTAVACLPDEAFVRGRVPMTKEEVREVALAKLRVRPTSTVWDVGAGTGSVSVEAALAASEGRVIAIERGEEACGLIRRNAAAFGLTNLQVVSGEAPGALAGLPAPDCVFVGGSGGSLGAVVEAALAANPQARVVIAAVTLETLAEAVACVRELEVADANIVQVGVSKAREAGSYHLMQAHNPVHLVSFGGREKVGRMAERGLSLFGQTPLAEKGQAPFRQPVPRLMVAGTASGVGKTILTCALLRAFARRGLRLQAAKCGPDYLDPAFHERVLEAPSRNLDLFLGSEELARELLCDGGREADLTVIEGVMGYYDGLSWGTDASSHHLARATRTPVVLVADARGRALSVAAEIAGFVRFRQPSQVAAVLLNRASAASFPQLKAVVEREAGVPVVGYVPLLDEARLASRHLGLVAAGEIPDLLERVDAVADVLQATVDLDALVALAREAEPLAVKPRALPSPRPSRPLIAVARDEAFGFYYRDTLALFERLGARFAFFSPLRDAALPEGACGLYLGGGYPELHAWELSQNEGLRHEIRAAVGGGMPTIAECGGYLYLHDTLEDDEGTSWSMAGVVGGHARRGERLGRFGYVTLTARCDGLLAKAGQTLAAHEFHCWQSDVEAHGFHAQKPQSERGWDAVVSTPTLYAGFPHLYLAGSPEAAARFVDACAAFGVGTGGGR